jgi:hypothetical protein
MWNCKINEKWDTTIKQGVPNNVSEIISVHLHKNTIMNELHNLGLFIFLIKKTQTNYM